MNRTEPRFIRAGQAPAYLGMGRKLFTAHARPYLTEFRIGKQGVAFDREELDRFADQYKETHKIDKAMPQADDSRCTGRSHERSGGFTWHAKQSAASTKGTASGTSINSSKESDFSKALERVRGKKPKRT